MVEVRAPANHFLHKANEQKVVDSTRLRRPNPPSSFSSSHPFHPKRPMQTNEGAHTSLFVDTPPTPPTPWTTALANDLPYPRLLSGVESQSSLLRRSEGG